MRIEQQNPIAEILQPNSSKAIITEKSTPIKAKCSKNKSVFIKDSTYLNPALEEKKNLKEEFEEKAGMDATFRKNQMAVLAHTTSEEDYAKMQEEGFSLDATNGGTIVTVIDKIKAQIVKAGGDISCFEDDLTREQLEELVGNETLAAQIKKALKQADLPVSEDNIEDCMKAYALTENLSPLTEGGIKYMLDNNLEPTIENIYKAAYSGGSCYVTTFPPIDMGGMQAQVEEIITEAGLPVNERTLKDSQWLLANDIALTAKNLSYFEDLKAYTGITNTDDVVWAMAEAIAEGKSPKDGMLLTGQGEMEQIKDDIRLLTAKRQLEETRLCMTSEANYALLKKGISIDTKPLEELVEDLKQQEHAYYERLLEAEGVEASEENIHIIAETNEKLNAIKIVPAYVLGLPDDKISHIDDVYENGTAIKAALERANQSYEPLMTTVRKDLGDSFEKAFRNVDDLLREMELEVSKANQRAVRILAYNQSEITQESILRVKAADEEVQRVFKNLTPHVVVEMLRRGDNPLAMDFQMINKTAESIRHELDENDTERFSEYLWKLERKSNISEEERSAYIGVYRLLHQVEQTDGAAIGALINQGSDITLKNLLTAVRSSHKQKKMDFRVDEAFGERAQDSGYRNSITDQIMAGYQANCIKDAKEALTPDKLTTLMKQEADWMEMTPEQFAGALKEAESEDEQGERAYIKEQLDLIKQSAMSSQEVYQMLEQYDIPNSIQNILAMETMTRNRNQLYKKLFDPKEALDRGKEQLLNSFGEAISSPKELAKAQETLAKVAENAMKTIIDKEEVTYIDIREVKLMQAQLQIQKKMAKNETYSVPVQVGDEITNVTLKIVHGIEKRGMVDIMLESRVSGKIAATFQAKEKQIAGVITTDQERTKEEFLTQLDTYKNILREKNEEIDLKVAYIPELDLNHFSAQTEKESVDSASEAEGTTTTRLYRIAESFIRAVKENYR